MFLITRLVISLSLVVYYRAAEKGEEMAYVYVGGMVLGLILMFLFINGNFCNKPKIEALTLTLGYALFFFGFMALAGLMVSSHTNTTNTAVKKP